MPEAGSSACCITWSYGAETISIAIPWRAAAAGMQSITRSNVAFESTPRRKTESEDILQFAARNRRIADPSFADWVALRRNPASFWIAGPVSAFDVDSERH